MTSPPPIQQYVSPSPADTARLLAVAESRQLEREEAVRLMHTSGTGLVDLMLSASRLRDAGKGPTVSYSRKVFIPLTNLCRDKCGYCTFAKAPQFAAARTLTPDEVLAIARQGKANGCHEALFTLGDHPEERWAAARQVLARLGYPSTISYVAAMCTLVFEETGLLPHVNCGLLSSDELLEIREVTASIGLMLESTSERLLEKGGAHYGCVTKAPNLRLDTIARASEFGIACTSGMLIGIGETLSDRVDSLIALRDIQTLHGNLQEVIIQNFRAKPDTRMRSAGDPSALDMLRTLAVARLILGKEQNIQAPPNLAPEAHPLYLLAGINDWGGVSPVTIDHVNPEREWPEIAALAESTAEAGFQLRERLCLYPEYIQRSEFVRERLQPGIEALVDETGLVTIERNSQ